VRTPSAIAGQRCNIVNAMLSMSEHFCVTFG